MKITPIDFSSSQWDMEFYFCHFKGYKAPAQEVVAPNPAPMSTDIEQTTRKQDVKRQANRRKGIAQSILSADSGGYGVGASVGKTILGG